VGTPLSVATVCDNKAYNNAQRAGNSLALRALSSIKINMVLLLF